MSDNTGIWIPEPVLGLTDLTPIEKMLFSVVLPLTFTEPCWAGNPYFAKRIGVSEQTVSNNLGLLHDKGYIRLFVDRVGGNTRQIHTYILEDTLYKYVGKPLSKFDRPLYKDFIEGIQNLYRASIKSLYTLYKDFIFTYKDDNKIDNKEDNKTYKQKVGADAPFKFALQKKFAVYQDWKTYSTFITAEKTKIKFPSHWNEKMIDLYENDWLVFRQKLRKKLEPKSIQRQVDELANLKEDELKACINSSISNGYQGLFPEKFKRGTKTSFANGNSPPPPAPVEAESYSDLIDHDKAARLRATQTARSQQLEPNF